MKTMVYVGTHRVLDEIGKDKLPAELVPRRPHTHHALDDAVEQAELFQNLRRWRMPTATATCRTCSEHTRRVVFAPCLLWLR